MEYVRKFNNYFKDAYLLNHFPSIFELIFSGKKVFGYYGFLGDNNFGDELVFESAKSLFAPDLLFPLKKRMPLSHMLYFKFFKNMISGVVIGGGTLVGTNFYYYDKYFDYLIKSGKPIYLHGTGVGDSKTINKGWRILFRKKKYGGIRGPLSKSKLNEFKISSNIVGDAAFGMISVNQKVLDRKSDNKVLINLGTHHNFKGEENSRNEFNKFVEYLVKNGFQVLFLPFHKIDVKQGIKLRSLYPEIILLNIPKSYSEAFKIFQDSKFAVGERLHFSVMAVLAGCPFRSINYSRKHEDFLASLNIRHLGFNPNKISLKIFVDAFLSDENFCPKNIFLKILNFKEVQLQEKDFFLDNIKPAEKLNRFLYFIKKN